MSSKVLFRARNLDAHKQMPVFTADELPDLSEYAAVNRQVAAMPTGMEKEEEMELHLVEAMTAQQQMNTGLLMDSVVIPTPRVTVDAKNYDDIYSPTYCPPVTMIKVEASLNVEPELCEYDADSEDDIWLRSDTAKQACVTYEDFESIMDRLERNSERQVISLKEAHSLMPHADDDVLQAVYDYWMDKRMRVRHVLCPRVKTERREATNNSSGAVPNPYIAFRRRAEKMRTRVNRKNDEDGYEKMLKLMTEWRRASTLFEMVKRREKSKRELINIDADLFDRRHELRDWSGHISAQCQQTSASLDQQPSTSVSAAMQQRAMLAKQTRKKRGRKDEGLATAAFLQQMQIEFHKPAQVPTSPPREPQQAHRTRTPSAITNVLDLIEKLSSKNTYSEIDGTFHFRRAKGCQYHAPLSNSQRTDDRYIDAARQKMDATQHDRFKPTFIHAANASRHTNGNVPLTYIGNARRRVGRGGRILIDRRHNYDHGEEIGRHIELPCDLDDDHHLAQPSTSNLRPINDRAQLTLPYEYNRPLLQTAPRSQDPCLTSALSKEDEDEAMSLLFKALPGLSDTLKNIDSGYSSPTRSRSRNGLYNVQPPYALVRTAKGDLCRLPITVGISAELYPQHAQHLQETYNNVTQPQSTSCDEAPRLTQHETQAISIDNQRALESCSVVSMPGTMAKNQISSSTLSPVSNKASYFIPAVANGHSIDENTQNHIASSGEMIITANQYQSHHPLPTPSPSPNDDRSDGACSVTTSQNAHEPPIKKRRLSASAQSALGSTPPTSDDDHQVLARVVEHHHG